MTAEGDEEEEEETKKKKMIKIKNRKESAVLGRKRNIEKQNRKEDDRIMTFAYNNKRILAYISNVSHPLAYHHGYYEDDLA